MGWPEGRVAFGEPWIECDICGFFFPQSLMEKQRGLNVCTWQPDFDEENPQDPDVTK
jgi:hypothetical protein